MRNVVPVEAPQPVSRHEAVRAPRLATAIYLAAIAAAEGMLVIWGPVAGTLADAVLLVVLLSHFTLLTPETVGGGAGERSLAFVRTLPVLALLPLLRVLSITMPAERFPQVEWYAMVAVPLALAIYLTMRLLDLSLADIGFTRRSLLAQAGIAVTGIPLALAAYELTHPHVMVVRSHTGSLILGAIILFLGTGVLEEILFRGLIQQALIRLFGRLGVPLAALIFAAMYAGTLSVRYVGFILIIGLFYGWCAARTRSLWGVSISHGVLNVGLLLVLPLMLR